MSSFFMDPILQTLMGIYALLIAASVITVLLRKFSSGRGGGELEQRVKSWWIMVTIFTVAMMLSRNISLSFFGFISFLALKEYFSIIPTRRADRRVLFWAYLAIPIQFYWASIEWYGMFIIFIPVYLFLFLPMRMVMIGETKQFLQAAGTIHWGLMTMVFGISHLAYLLVLEGWERSQRGGVGLVLFLVMLTQLNDVAQYVWGKSLGKHKIIAKVSPNKTWEGYIGGLILQTSSTLLFYFVISKLFRVPEITWPTLTIFAMLIYIVSVIGDLSESLIKRDSGVKDSGKLIPGHGGVLDLVDALMLTIPGSYYYIIFVRHIQNM